VRDVDGLTRVDDAVQANPDAEAANMAAKAESDSFPLIDPKRKESLRARAGLSARWGRRLALEASIPL
jgi:hypothetical protein